MDRAGSIAVLAALRTVGWAAALALIVGAATTVVAVVRLSFEARHEEIAIMGLVGAPVSYIRGPFVMEGALQGALGALGALGRPGVPGPGGRPGAWTGGGGPRAPRRSSRSPGGTR